MYVVSNLAIRDQSDRCVFIEHRIGNRRLHDVQPSLVSGSETLMRLEVYPFVGTSCDQQLADPEGITAWLMIMKVRRFTA